MAGGLHRAMEGKLETEGVQVSSCQLDKLSVRGNGSHVGPEEVVGPKCRHRIGWFLAKCAWQLPTPAHSARRHPTGKHGGQGTRDDMSTMLTYEVCTLHKCRT